MQFSMHPAVVVAIGAVAVGLGVVAVMEGGPGSLMFGLAALVAHGLNRRELLAWSDLDTAAMQRRSRRGATAKWLELDTGERLITVPAYRLGAPVSEVLAAIDTAREHPHP